MKAGDYVKLLKPKMEKQIGQGEPPTAMKVITEGKVHELHYGDVFKLTEKGKQIINGDVLNLEFAIAYKKLFQVIKK